MHLHAYLKLKKPVNFSDPHCLDLTAENVLDPSAESVSYHGNYQGCRSAAAVKRLILNDILRPECTMVCNNLSFE